MVTAGEKIFSLAHGTTHKKIHMVQFFISGILGRFTVLFCLKRWQHW